MMEIEVPQALYNAIMGNNPSKFKGDNLPVENVSWYDAIMFCNELSKEYNYKPVYNLSITGKGVFVTRDPSANGFRLPTEEEWEFAARGGESYKYAGSDNIDEVAWHHFNSGGHTHWVGQKKPNGYGLYDMSGNVEEWCECLTSDFFRYLRGGDWRFDEKSCRISDRTTALPEWTGFDATNDYGIFGFRVVMEIK